MTITSDWRISRHPGNLIVNIFILPRHALVCCDVVRLYEAARTYFIAIGIPSTSALQDSVRGRPPTLCSDPAPFGTP